MAKAPSPILDTWQSEIPELHGEFYWEIQPHVNDFPL